jgi:hypothetical protein
MTMTTTKATHTPGKIGTEFGDAECLYLADETGRIVAKVMREQFGDLEAPANADRIKAAWNSHDDLLAACEEVDSLLVVLFGDAFGGFPETLPTPIGVPVKAGEIVRSLRAAIAQAKP